MAVSTMGGNVAENAGGPRAVKYGVTKDYLLGVEVVLATGEIMRTGGKTLKNVSGYNLTQLFCGSEGTLGIITEMTFKLIPLPETKRTLQAAYKNLSDAGKTIARVFEIGILPVALEILDKVCINIIEDYTHLGLPREAEALLLIEVDGPEAAVVAQAERLTALCREMGAHEVATARTMPEIDEIWRARRSAYGATARLRLHGDRRGLHGPHREPGHHVPGGRPDRRRSIICSSPWSPTRGTGISIPRSSRTSTTRRRCSGS